MRIRWGGDGAFTIITYNPTSWGTLLTYLDRLDEEVDIVLVQETHLHDPLRLAAATTTLAGRGWHSFHAPAAVLPSGLYRVGRAFWSGANWGHRIRT